MCTYIHTLLASETSLQASEAPSLVMKTEARELLYIYDTYVKLLRMREIAWQPMQPIIYRSRIS